MILHGWLARQIATRQVGMLIMPVAVWIEFCRLLIFTYSLVPNNWEDWIILSLIHRIKLGMKIYFFSKKIKNISKIIVFFKRISSFRSNAERINLIFSASLQFQVSIITAADINTEKPLNTNYWKFLSNHHLIQIKKNSHSIA